MRLDICINERIIERRIFADEFNKYCVFLAPIMNISLSPDRNDHIPNFQTFIPGSNPNSIFLYDCSAEEICKIISEFENGKSSDISVKIIKKSNKFISPILAQHFNYLIKIGKFPDDLKTGRITPIYKKIMQIYLKIID